MVEEPPPVRSDRSLTQGGARCNETLYKKTVNTLPRSNSSEFNSSLSSFSCYYTNAQSIYNKHAELADIVFEKKPMVIGITETWLKSDIKE